MIQRGAVNASMEARLTLRLRGPSGNVLDVDALIDTGFSGQLSLPLDVASGLGLNHGRAGQIILADGSSVPYLSFGIEVEWSGSVHQVRTAAFGDDVVIGMGLLSGHALMIEATVGGAVTIVLLMSAL